MTTAASPDDRAAAIQRVHRLRSKGFAVVPLPNILGYVDGLLATRFRDGLVESVLIRGSECAIATQIPNHFNPTDPFGEPAPLWSTADTVAKSSTNSLAHPPPSTQEPPMPIIADDNGFPSSITGSALPITWRRGLIEPRRAHVQETEDGTPRTIPTNEGRMPIAICQAWLAGTPLATDTLGDGTIEQCTACADYCRQLPRIQPGRPYDR